MIGRKVSKRRLLDAVYETARGSIGLPVPPSSKTVALVGPTPRRGLGRRSSLRRSSMVHAEGRGLIRQRDAIERRGEGLLAHDADHQRLRTMPGIGPTGALTILAEAGDLRRLRHRRQFLKLGWARPRHPSAERLSRPDPAAEVRQRPTAAHLFRIAGQVAIRRRDTGFRDMLEPCIARDRSSAGLRREALAAIAAKMARDLPRHRRPASPTARSPIGRCQAGEPLRAFRTRCDPVGDVRVFRLNFESRLEDGEGRRAADRVLVMAGTASLTAKAAWITLSVAPSPAGAARSVAQTAPSLPT